MSGHWKTAAEWASEKLIGMPGTERNVNALACRDNWRGLSSEKARKRKGRGGGWEYHISCLPAAAQADYHPKVQVQVLKNAPKTPNNRP